MLSRIRGSLNSFVVLILMGLLIAVFALWGIGDIFRTPGVETIATVGDEKITATQLDSRLQSEIRERQKTMPDLDMALALQLGLDRAVLADMVRNAVLADAAVGLGLTASNDQVRRIIAEEETFRLLGEFDITRYRQFLRAAKLDEAELFDNVRGDRARVDFVNGIGQIAPLPRAMLEPQLRFLLESRTGTVATVPVERFEVTGEPGEEALAAYFAENAQRYRAPEYRAFDYIALTRGDVAATLEITDEEVAASYERYRDEFSTPELRRVERVVFQSRAEAEAFLAKVKSGAGFAATAQAMAGFSADDVALGDLARADLVGDYGEDVAQAVFALDAAGPTPPVETPFGWQVFNVAHIEPGEERSLDEVREEVRQRLAEDKAAGLLFQLSQQLDDAFATGANLQQAAESLGLRWGAMPAISRQGVRKDGQALENGAEIRAMLEAVFRGEMGGTLEILPLGDDGYFVVSLKAIEPERALTLEEARGDVMADWRRAEADRLAKAAAEALAEKARGGEDLSLLASQAGYAAVKDVSFERLQVQQGAGGLMAAANLLFSMQPDTVATGPTAAGNGYLVARLVKVVPGDPNSGRAEIPFIAQQLRQIVGNDLQQQLVAALEQEARPRINDKALSALRNRYNASAIN
ncbi:MAG: peptidyl-prolyl cis-trans isomerase [Pseudomonadota bacterium]